MADSKLGNKCVREKDVYRDSHSLDLDTCAHRVAHTGHTHLDTSAHTVAHTEFWKVQTDVAGTDQGFPETENEILILNCSMSIPELTNTRYSNLKKKKRDLVILKLGRSCTSRKSFDNLI